MLKSTITINNVDIILGRVAVDQTIRDIIDEYSYNQDMIKQMVEQAFKKGWEDGWSNTYLETNFDTSTTYAFTITAKYDEYTC